MKTGIRGAAVTGAKYILGNVGTQPSGEGDMSGGQDVLSQDLQSSIKNGPGPIRRSLDNIFGKNNRTGILGVNFSLASMLKQSQVFTTTTGTVFQLLGAMIDWVLGKGIMFAIEFISTWRDFRQKMKDIVWDGMQKLGSAVIDFLDWFTSLEWVSKAWSMFKGSFWQDAKNILGLSSADADRNRFNVGNGGGNGTTPPPGPAGAVPAAVASTRAATGRIYSKMLSPRGVNNNQGAFGTNIVGTIAQQMSSNFLSDEIDIPTVNSAAETINKIITNKISSGLHATAKAIEQQDAMNNMSGIYSDLRSRSR